MGLSFDDLKKHAEKLPPSHPIWDQIKQHQELVDAKIALLIEKQRNDRSSR